MPSAVGIKPISTSVTWLAVKFGSRYATFGFEDAAHLDDGTLWTTSFAVTALSKADEKRLAELVAQAAG